MEKQHRYLRGMVCVYMCVHYDVCVECGIPYSRKYWRELNLAVGSQMAIAKALADFNLAVRYEMR